MQAQQGSVLAWWHSNLPPVASSLMRSCAQSAFLPPHARLCSWMQRCRAHGSARRAHHKALDQRTLAALAVLVQEGPALRRRCWRALHQPAEQEQPAHLQLLQLTDTVLLGPLALGWACRTPDQWTARCRILGVSAWLSRPRARRLVSWLLTLKPRCMHTQTAAQPGPSRKAATQGPAAQWRCGGQELLRGHTNHQGCSRSLRGSYLACQSAGRDAPGQGSGPGWPRRVVFFPASRCGGALAALCS